MKTMDRFEDAECGVCIRFGQEPIMAYDYNKVIEMLMEDEMDYDEAVEFFEFNIIGAWVGDDTPCFICPKDEFFVDGEYFDLDEQPQ